MTVKNKARTVGVWKTAVPIQSRPANTLNSPAIATLLPEASAILPPMSWVIADARVLMAPTYPIRRSLAPEAVTLKETKGAATLVANEFQNAWIFSLSAIPRHGSKAA